MASRDQRKMGLKAKSILQKRIVNVTSVIKLNFDLFSGRLQEEGLIPVGRYNPEDRVMNKSENATALYGDCMTAVEVNPTKFSVVMDILSEFSLLEAIVQEMTKEGVKAGLMKPRKDRKPSKKEASVKVQAGSKRKHTSDDEEVHKKEKKTKRTSQKAAVKVSSDSPSSSPSSSYSRESLESEDSDSVLDSDPNEKDMRMLVANEVTNSGALGNMLNLKLLQIEMFKKEERDNTVSINMRILTTWIERMTKKPTTWRTLIGALREMGMEKLANKITKELEQRRKRN